MAESCYFIGLISGTSVDGVDAALVEFQGGSPRLLATHCEPMPEALRNSILALCTDQPVSLRQLGETGIETARCFADAANQVLEKSGKPASLVRAIGSHGQTVYHHPDSAAAFTLQIGDGATIAEHTGIPVVSDFRSADMAAGGQGAPLAPLFHQACFHSTEKQRLVLNLGGISNLSILHSDPEGPVTGFDCGPANVLMDGWIQQKRGLPYDRDGLWAASGRVNAELLEQCLREPYFARPIPKSTGRERFNREWLERQLTKLKQPLANQDVQATLLELTARTVVDAVEQHSSGEAQLLVCGGGAHNRQLMQRLAELLPDHDVIESGQLGVSADWVEAVTFAWLARAFMEQRSVDCRRLTGARHPCVLGALHHAASAPEAGS